MVFCNVTNSTMAGILLYEKGILYSADVYTWECSYGIYNKGYISSIFSNIYNTQIGLYSNSQQIIDVTDGAFTDNSEFGMLNNSEQLVNAQYNYWGSAQGPSTYDSGLETWSDNGNRIAGSIDYIPWNEESPF